MDIIAMHRSGLSVRKIARKLGIHRKTVKKHIEAGDFPHYHKRKSVSILEPYKQIINDYLEEDDYQATWIFDRIKKIGYPGGYDTVKHYVSDIKEQKTRIAYIRFETEPGLQAQVDWGDFQVQEADGKTRTVYAFVLVLGYSRAMYVEFVDRCTLDVFMDCHIHAFCHLQGIPAEILYDNMKNVIIGRENGKAVFNIEFLYFAHHYGFLPKIAPPYSPWVKGKVERPIDYIRERFWRGYSFSSTQNANKDIINWLSETANRRIHGTHREPVDERWAREIPCLKNHPPSDYDTSLKVFRKVYKDCLLSYNGNRYQVPYHVVGRRVMLKIKDDIICIYHDQELLATYREPKTKHNLIGDPHIYEQLKHDKEQLSRKYGRDKGKATRGLVTGSLYADVIYRPLAEYERYAQGGVSWNN
ncbi:MAG: IS21 family transposase [Nitrospirota bacterium]